MATQQRLPTGNISVQCSKMGASSNWDCVNDPVGSPDDFTTRCYGDGTDKLSFTAFDIPAGSMINSVKLYVRNRIEYVQCTGKGLIWVNGTPYNFDLSATNWSTELHSWTTNPNTGAAWAVNDVNGSGSHALQALGYILASYSDGKTTYNALITQVYLEADYTPPSSYDKSGSISGTGSVSASATKIVAKSASISGVGSIIAAGSAIKSKSASISGVGSVIAGTYVEQEGAAELSGIGEMVAEARLVLDVEATIAGTGEIMARLTRQQRFAVPGGVFRVAMGKACGVG